MMVMLCRCESGDNIRVMMMVMLCCSCEGDDDIVAMMMVMLCRCCANVCVVCGETSIASGSWTTAVLEMLVWGKKHSNSS